jgi:hypothetical protein
VTDVLTPVTGAQPDPGPDPLDDLLDGDPAALRQALLDAGVNVDALWSLPRWNTAGDIAYRRRPDDLPRVDAVLTAAFRAASRYRFGVAHLLAYLHHQCDSTWDVSYHFTPIWTTLRGAGAV